MAKITQKDKMNYVRHRLKTDEKWAKQALLLIYSKQTLSEQASGTTHLYNNVGFAGNDAEFLSSLAVQLKSRGSLSPKQMAILMKRIHKYSRQVIENSSMVKLLPLIEAAKDTQLSFMK